MNEGQWVKYRTARVNVVSGRHRAIADVLGSVRVSATQLGSLVKALTQDQEFID